MPEPVAFDARALLAAARPVGALADGRSVLAVHGPAGSALEAWRALAEAHPETGLWPFLTDPKRDDRSPTVWANLADYRQVSVDETETDDVSQLFTRWHAEYLEEDGDDPFYDEEEIELEAAHR